MEKGKGSLMIIFLFLFIVIGGSILFAGGIFPKFIRSVPSNPNQAYIPVPLDTTESAKSLQLRTIDFKTPIPTPAN